MLGLFGTLNLASSALQAQMTGVEVAGQNLANVNTQGYSRQRVNIQTAPDVQTSLGSEGTGATVASIQQITEVLLNRQIQNQSAVTGYWNQMQSSLQTAQTALGTFLSSASGAGATGSSASSSGLSSQLSAFFNAAQALATTPTSTSARQAFLGAAQSLATTFNQINTGMDNLRTSLNQSLGDQVSSANQLLSDIAGLNAQIVSAKASGGTPNDLLDLREQKLEQLSQYISYKSTTGSDGSISISMANQSMVSGTQLVDTMRLVDIASPGNPQVWTTNSNNLLTGPTVGNSSGSLEALIDARDGTVATAQTSINSLATSLIAQVNALHSTGYSQTGTTGAIFFTGTTAADMGVNQTLVNDPSLIQASGNASATGDNTIALQLAQLGSAQQAALNNETFTGAYGSTVAALGQSLQNAATQVSDQTAVANMLSTQRSSVSGVNLDEEMTNMLTFQRAYQASAHVVTTVDQMIQTVLAMKT